MKKRSIPPIIKWSGSKRTVAPALSEFLIPAKHFYDPFVGGGAILPFRKSQRAIAGDVIPELITLWQSIQSSPELVANGYQERWARLQSEGYLVYYEIRDRFNSKRDPIDLLFLSRTCVNGLIRFNKEGNFNNSLHHTRPGISPISLNKIIHEWSVAIQGIDFVIADYKDTLRTVKKGDFIFLDPPYGGTRGRYIPNTFNLDEFYGELDRLNSRGAFWLLTFDGLAGERTYSSSLPKSLYKSHFYIDTGKSPFTRLMKKSLDQIQESVYINFTASKG